MKDLAAFDCVGGDATFYVLSGNAAAFRECVIVSYGAAIAHDSDPAGQDVFERCLFSNMALTSRWLHTASSRRKRRSVGQVDESTAQFDSGPSGSRGFSRASLRPPRDAGNRPRTASTS